MKKNLTQSHITLIYSLATLTVIVLVSLGFIIWASSALGPQPEALMALNSNDRVKIQQTADWISFKPLAQTPRLGFIFYPGGKVEFRSYAPALEKIAEKGYLVVLPSMPLNLALFSPYKAADVIAAFPDVSTWALGGHSLGGSMAAFYALNHVDQIKGMVFWASYPSGTDNLAQKGLKVLMVYGTKDGLVTPNKLESARSLLPLDTTWFPIEGGNHAQFGDYGSQPGDNPALISALEQQSLAVKATVEFLSSLAPE